MLIKADTVWGMRFSSCHITPGRLWKHFFFALEEIGLWLFSVVNSKEIAILEELPVQEHCFHIAVVRVQKSGNFPICGEDV